MPAGTQRFDLDIMTIYMVSRIITGNITTHSDSDYPESDMFSVAPGDKHILSVGDYTSWGEERLMYFETPGATGSIEDKEPSIPFTSGPNIYSLEYQWYGTQSLSPPSQVKLTSGTWSSTKSIPSAGPSKLSGSWPSFAGLGIGAYLFENLSNEIIARHFLEMDFYEIIIFDKILTTAEHNDVIDYLENKWNL
jgi:hypothetical protein